jgi:hypothetical protein
MSKSWNSRRSKYLSERRVRMYSPKVREDLIPRIYQIARKSRIPMTVWVNQVIERALMENGKEIGQETKNENSRKEK